MGIGTFFRTLSHSLALVMCLGVVSRFLCHWRRCIHGNRWSKQTNDPLLDSTRRGTLFVVDRVVPPLSVGCGRVELLLSVLRVILLLCAESGTFHFCAKNSTLHARSSTFTLCAKSSITIHHAESITSTLSMESTTSTLS
jgi:hypothetical protein